MLTQELIDEAVAIVKAGNFRSVAAQMLGIGRRTFYDWLQKGRVDLKRLVDGKVDHYTLHAKFVIAMERADGESHASILQDILDGDETPAAVKLQFLKLRYPKQYAMATEGIDDETGSTSQTTGVQLLAQALERFTSGPPLETEDDGSSS